MNENIDDIIGKMTLEEKASLCSGQDFWHLKGIERLGIPSIMVTDGPHGLRKQRHNSENVALFNSVPATCFPTASATASSWDRDLLYEVGQALGEECKQEDVAVILGPGANIKRSPLCGRNFEYFSEDPYLTGEMASCLVNGVQSRGVGTSLKHFAVNNQERLRMTINAVIDERTLREIYLAGFEMVVKNAHPWTVMSSYNKLDGVYTSEYEGLLTSILRDEWGFEGLVMTDWGACNDRVAGLNAGQDLEMPSSSGLNDARIVKAVKSGALDMAVLDRAVKRLLELIFRSVENRNPGFKYDLDAHHKLARRAASESVVLLKNDDNLLPLKKDAKIALIGSFAKTPRYQGSGSSLMNPTKLDTACEEVAEFTSIFTYAAGYDVQKDEPNETLIQEACEAARNSDVAIIFAGLPDHYETEAVDRSHMHMPDSHNVLIRRIAEVNPNTVVVLSNGAPVAMPWVGDVKGILECFLGGQAGASGVLDILFGRVNPSGKLSETYALKLEDHASSRYFPMGPKTVEYRESIYVGYRYFEKAQRPVQFPFGFGLSYTSFEYSDFALSAERISDSDGLKVSIVIKNTGRLAGAEVVQLYVRDVDSTIFRPVKELKGFNKVFLQPDQEKRIEFSLDKRSFSYYNTSISDWHVESGDFEIMIGASSADIRASGKVWVESTRPEVQIPDFRQTAPIYYDLAVKDMEVSDAAFKLLYGAELPSRERLPGEPYTINSTLNEVKNTPVGRKLYDQVMESSVKMFGGEENETHKKMAEAMMGELPIRNLVIFSNGAFTYELVDSLLLMMNGKPVQGMMRQFIARVKKR